MRIVVALGGNALLKRGEPMTAETQRKNVRTASPALAAVAAKHQLVISHGNGPQVGLLALQGAAYTEVEAYPGDVRVVPAPLVPDPVVFGTGNGGNADNGPACILC